ncbi:LOW QUALITY PROTEIN: hypothetical protein U9M48_040483 [Paspalum notatum var. saurae]|uniref:Acyl-[acyl-carrier-protein] desaturase n=1 Tax=Paspalum notatum var. saurae TaxID=547442 RepID=A0AAQ3UNI1_PASNO
MYSSPWIPRLLAGFLSSSLPRPWSSTIASGGGSTSPIPMTVLVKREKKKTKFEEDDEEEEWMGHLAPAKLEVLAHLEPWVESHVLPLLRPVESSWQPSDLLPDPAALGEDGFASACRRRARRRPRVPGGQHGDGGGAAHSVPNRFEAVRDLTGADATAWARWIRGWSAEENRHGDALSRYMYLSARVDMRQVDRTVHRLIAAGMASRRAERATAVAHGNTARGHGDAALARICGAIAADEKRHEAAYTRIVGKLFEADPDAAVRALGYMMRRRITMPAALMTDGRDDHLYAHYSAAAQQAGVYTASDYREVLEHLIREWRVEELAAGLSGEGRRARDYVCGLPGKIRRMEEKAHDRAAQARKEPTSVPFSWIFDRPVSLQPTVHTFELLKVDTQNRQGNKNPSYLSAYESPFKISVNCSSSLRSLSLTSDLPTLYLNKAFTAVTEPANSNHMLLQENRSD